MNAPAPLRGTSARGPATRIEVIADLDALTARKAQWNDLWRRVPDATPFQSPAWLTCWARHYAPDRTGAIAALCGDTLVALLPFFFWKRALWLAGTGPSDYGDALVAPDAPPIADALLQALAGVACDRGCGRIDLRQLRARSALLAAVAPRGWRDRIEPGDACMAMRLDPPGGLGSAPGKVRRNLARASRMLDRFNAERVPEDQVRNGVRALLHLHERRWQARGEAGLFANRRLRAFVRAVAPNLQDAGLLRLYWLTRDGHPLAVTFALHGPGVAYLYATGFEPEWARASPGLLSIAAALRGAAEEGDRAADLLRGCERYKYHLGATEGATSRRVLVDADHRGRRP